MSRTSLTLFNQIKYMCEELKQLIQWIIIIAINQSSFHQSVILTHQVINIILKYLIINDYYINLKSYNSRLANVEKISILHFSMTLTSH